ncbi:MAG TPA: rhodanese-like domain-containing protein [Gaiellaceae bacterium]|nr:rhodanese-like domain-containing protein [Gaiellaceae bacterium]
MRYQFVDCRWELGKPGRGRELYHAGHVPGASFLDVEEELSAPPSTPGGRHPLPAAEDFARAAGAAGIGAGVFVVAYDQGMNGGAARLWWLLRHFGHDDVAVLEGGLGAWAGPLRTGEEAAEPAEFTPRERRGDTIDADELRRRLGDERLTIVDARVPERYRGEVEPIDPVAGRIPGAVNAPYTEPLPTELLEARELVAYCGSGITAAVTLLRLAQAGREDGKLYPGSWSDWVGRGLPGEQG